VITNTVVITPGTNNAEVPKKSSSQSSKVVIGAVAGVAAFLVLVLIVAAILFVRYREKKRRAAIDEEKVVAAASNRNSRRASMAQGSFAQQLTFVEDIQFHEKLGSGNFGMFFFFSRLFFPAKINFFVGEVYKGLWQGSTLVALKKLRGHNSTDDFEKEAIVLQ
jgi:hypothetical protein